MKPEAAARATIHDLPGFPELREECGVFAVYGHPDAVPMTYHGLYALQHRGQESAGIVATGSPDTGGQHAAGHDCGGEGADANHPGSPEEFAVHKGMGLVSEVFSRPVLEALSGAGRRHALGHVRYSTTGASRVENAQPLVLRCRGSRMALAHNGNLVDARRWRERLEAEGAIFQTTTDTEVIAHLAAREGGSWEQALNHALDQVHGGYAIGVLTPEGIFAARDPHGIRPLVLGRRDGAYIVASETCALETVAAEVVREIEAGERIWIDASGVRTVGLQPADRPAFCIFEYVYFARPDSRFHGRTVHHVRKELGRRLALEAPVDADVVIGVPDSSLPAAAGYSEAAGIPSELGLIKNRYVGRTFIRPGQSTRTEAVRIKLNPVRGVVEGRRVIVVDDSLVRGTTSRQLVRSLRDAGAREVHLRITSPPYRHSCHYGIDTADRGQLIAANRDIDEIRQMVGADSLHFLSVEAMLAATGQPPDRFCLGCFTGRYPVPPLEAEKLRVGGLAGPGGWDRA